MLLGSRRLQRLVLSLVVLCFGLSGTIPAYTHSTPDFFLHGAGAKANPPTLFINLHPPKDDDPKYRDSASLSVSGGNQWKELGTWKAESANIKGTLLALNPLHVWLGLKQSADQGARFDLRAELLKNGAVVTTGQTLCLSGLVKGTSSAKHVQVPFPAIPPTPVAGAMDVFALRISARMGTTTGGGSCGGLTVAAGLRLFFDGRDHPARINVSGSVAPTPNALLPNPLTIIVGASGTLSATLFPTPMAAGTLSATSGNVNVATVPASLSFARGQTQVPVPVTAVGAGTTQITVSAHGGSVSSTVQVTTQPPTVTSLAPGSLSITQGGAGTLIVTISAAQSTNTIVALSSTDPGIAFVPSGVTVPAGQTGAPITVSANTPGTAQVTASLNGTSASSTVTVTPALPAVVSLLPPANPVTIGATTTLTVTISAAQPTDTVVQVSASPGGIVSVPATVLVPANQTSAPVPVAGLALGTALVEASLNATITSSAVQVTAGPVALAGLTPSPLTVVQEATGTLTVTLNATQETNTRVTLSVDHETVLEVPARVTVPSGQIQASFTVTGLALGDAVVTATVNSTSHSATVHVVPPPPTVVALVPNPLAIQQGATSTFTLTINAAQLADTVIPLTNSGPAVLQAPSSVTVPTGQASVTFPVTGLTLGSATVTASINLTSASATVNVTPLPTVVTGLTPATGLVPKGTPAVLHVSVSPAATEPQTVALTSNSTAVATVPATVPIPAGALGADFPVLSLSEGSATITATLNGGTASALVVVTPAELATLTLSPQTPTIFIGQTELFTATGTFTDGTTKDLTTSVTWSSSNQVVATINASGVASALAAGTTTITAASGSISADTTLTVLTPPALILTPATASLRVGDSLTMTITSAAPADVGGLAITLTQSGTGSVTLPTAVVIPDGQSSATFTITGATAGNVTITATAPMRLPASSALTITSTPPTITGFTPTSGKAGTNVTITGQDFDPVPASNQVRFNGMPAGVLSATSTTLIVTVPPTATTGFVSVTTAGGTAQSATSFGVIAITAFSVTPALATLPIGSTQQVRAIATFADQTTLDVTSFTTWGSSNPNVASVTGGGLAQGAAQGTATITGTLGSLMGSEAVQVIANDGSGPLPPDPSLVAPPIDRTVATTVGTATAFLYTGANPIQTGVAPGTIVTQRAAVVRGLVRGRDGFPIPGVTVTILNHPEFGQTRTRPDGMFDMAVNGGGQLTVNYTKNGLLPAQRQVDVPWQDYVSVPDVVMIALDPQVTAVTLTGATTIQVARGSAVSDADGTRQATLLFAPGTQATMILPGGTTQPLTTLSVRATEYTVGGTGPTAMPALLPANSAYTYAVSYSVDEAVNAGATSVQFTQPVITYVENFLGLPVGTTIPSGSYDRGKGVWVGSANGQIIKVLSVSGGVANVDTDGDGVADSGLGITPAEQQQLATLYQPGASLWRVPVTHFTEYDYNFGPGFPPGAFPPSVAFAHAVQQPCETCTQAGASNIVIQYQTLGETMALSGTPFTLHYQSDRVPGRLAANALEIPLSGASVPGPLKRIDLEVVVAGRRFTQSFPPLSNQTHTFQWDGKDAYGRTVQGALTYQVGVGYVYDLVYSSTQRWGANGSTPPLTPTQRRIEGTGWQRRVIAPTRWDARAAGLGGWSLSVQHAYDPVAHALYLGTGSQREADTLPRVITTVFQGSNFTPPNRVVAGPDGSVYIASQDNRIHRLVPGQAGVQIFAGNGTPGDSGDGGPATQAQLNNPHGVAVGPDGSVYIAEPFSDRIRKVDPTGIITTVAGTGTGGYSGDGGPATAAQLFRPFGVAVGPDGSVYIADTLNNVVRRIGPDGIITTVAGTGTSSFSGDGGPATQATLRGPIDVAIARDGTIYIGADGMVRRVGVDGIIRAVTRNGFFCPANFYPGDGGLASDANTGGDGVTVAPDGTVYVAGVVITGGFCSGAETRVYQIDPRGIVTTAAGTGVFGFSGDGGPATAAEVSGPRGVSVSPDGSLYMVDSGNAAVRRVAAPLPGLSASDVVLAGEDGSELYTFNNAGRHLRTQDALTGAVKYQFAYDSNGLLASVTDVAGQVTTIERDGNGGPTAIVAPGGQRTALSVEANGYLTTMTNPAGERVAVTYTADGLLATQTNAREVTSSYTYDGRGFLTQDADPAGGFSALGRTESTTGFTVSRTTALGRVTSYLTDTLTTGARHQVNTDAAGLNTDVVIKADGSRSLTAPDGTVTTSVQGPDPRFGMQAPIAKSLSVKLPSGLTSTLTTARTTALSNPADLLSLTSQTDTLVINGRTYSSVFNQPAKTITTTTPAGRTSTVTLDAQGRVIQEQVTGLEPVSYTYDSLGRLSTITQGTGASARTSTLSYDTKNQLTSVQDPLTRTVGFAYDLAGRITTQTLPDLRTIGYAYDANGNVTGITPPGKPQHAFAYTPVDLEAAYNPPSPLEGEGPNPPSPLEGEGGGEGFRTSYAYNLDRQLTLVMRPDGQTLSLGYDSGGRLSTLTIPGGVLQYAYSSTTGTLSSITAPNSTLSYSYDGSLLTNTSWAGTVAGSVSRTYDNNFRITSQSVNGSNTVTFGYDNDSLLTSAGSLAITRSAQNGLITGSTLGAVTDTRSNNPFGELSNYTANVSGSPAFSVTYTRDKLGRIIQKVETIGDSTDTFVYKYDTAGRLTDVTKNGTVLSHYTYDSNGNRLSATDSTGTVNGTYDAQDRLTQYGNLHLTYTANGELLTKTNPVLGQTANFSYDVLGNLKSVTLPGDTLVEYVVDGQNRRIGKKVNGTLVQGFLYQNQLNPVAELDGTGNILSRFVFGTKANVPDFMIKGGVTYRIVSDHLGSPRLVVNPTDGTIAQRLDYDEFGNITADTNPGFQPFGFAGGLYDQHTGLVRFGARDYDAQTGRWTSKDPIRFESKDSNLYGYVLNDPINFVDASGLIFVPGAIIGGVIGGVSALTGSLAQNAKRGDVLLSVAWGLTSGAITGGLPGLGSSLIAGGILGVGANLAGQILTEGCENINWSSVIGAGFGGVTGAKFGNKAFALGAGYGLGKIGVNAFSAGAAFVGSVAPSFGGTEVGLITGF